MTEGCETTSVWRSDGTVPAYALNNEMRQCRNYSRLAEAAPQSVQENLTCFNTTWTNYTNESPVFTRDNQCVNSCDGYTTSVTQMDCIDTCPEQYHYYIKTMRAVYSTSGNSAETLIYSAVAQFPLQLCLKECPRSAPYVFSADDGFAECVSVCPDGTFRESGVCRQKCDSGHYYLSQ